MFTSSRKVHDQDTPTRQWWLQIVFDWIPKLHAAEAGLLLKKGALSPGQTMACSAPTEVDLENSLTRSDADFRKEKPGNSHVGS